METANCSRFGASCGGRHLRCSPAPYAVEPVLVHLRADDAPAVLGHNLEPGRRLPARGVRRTPATSGRRCHGDAAAETDAASSLHPWTAPARQPDPGAPGNDIAAPAAADGGAVPRRGDPHGQRDAPWR